MYAFDELLEGKDEQMGRGGGAGKTGFVRSSC